MCALRFDTLRTGFYDPVPTVLSEAKAQTATFFTSGMLHKIWKIRSIDRGQVDALARVLSVSPLTATVLCGRGAVESDRARDWLAPSGGLTHDPFLLPDVEPALDRLHLAVQRGERVCFYGDYDVDGMSATSLHWLFWRSVGATAEVYIPHRQEEGYGLNEAAIRRLADRGVSVLVTADCGTTSHHEIELAGRLGIEVIVTDHHQIQSPVPRPLAFINPYRPDSRYPFQGLCSGALAYKLVEAYGRKFGASGVQIETFRDLVALSSIADVVPLRDENWVLVRDGLAQMTQGTRCGIRALTQCLALNGPWSASTVGFRVAPLLNAAGRLAHAGLGVQLLTTDSDVVALDLVQRLTQLNLRRRQIEQDITREAVTQVDAGESPPAIVVGAEGWHVGVLGIVAARLVERYHRPAIVVAFDQRGHGKGSARGIPGFDVCQALAECRPFLVAFGGHPMAAGVTVRKEVFSDFRRKFVDVAEGLIDAKMTVPTLEVDADVSLAQIRLPLLQELERLQPFGMGNPEPTFLSKGLSVLEKKVVGDDHLKLLVRQNHSAPLDGIGFRMGGFADALDAGHGRVDAVFSPELDHWKGHRRIQLRLCDLRMSDAEKDAHVVVSCDRD